jgi:hypothetical protein
MGSSWLYCFVGYVSIVTRTKDDLGYDKLSPRDKQTIDITRNARDACLRQNLQQPAVRGDRLPIKGAK